MSTLARKLGDDDIAEALKSLPGWSLKDGKLFASYRFADFSQAWAFMTRCALCAEKHDHHPEWKNVYNRVEIALWTHDCRAVTEKDVVLAGKFCEYAKVCCAG